MDCNIVKDLIPLYIDGCCSEESKKVVEAHIENCCECKALLEDMRSPSQVVMATEAPKTYYRLKDWKASVLQAALLFASFALITLGVALEAYTASGLMNGFWAVNLIIPATGFMLSLANWYFVSVYKTRKLFSNCSLMATLVFTICAYAWSAFHYEVNVFALFAGHSFREVLETLYALFLFGGIGILLMVVLCSLSKVLSNQYAKMLGKE